MQVKKSIMQIPNIIRENILKENSQKGVIRDENNNMDISKDN